LTSATVVTITKRGKKRFLSCRPLRPLLHLLALAVVAAALVVAVIVAAALVVAVIVVVAASAAVIVVVVVPVVVGNQLEVVSMSQGLYMSPVKS
jgi:hypothetical protein